MRHPSPGTQRALAAVVAFTLAHSAFAQETPPQPAAPPQQPARQDPLTVTATRTPTQSFDEPYSTGTVTGTDIERYQFRTLPQSLRYIPGVMIQETAPGQGSPFIRGFTGYSNLMLIDGVRLNNSTFRAGPNQYWSTVDVLSAERIEVVKGPGSTLYGSDAVGGTVQVFTRRPYAFGSDGVATAGRSYVRYGSAENSIGGRMEASVGRTWEDGSRTGVLLGGDARHFDDMEGGDATGTMLNTGYDENAFDVKFEHQASERERWVFLHQQTHQDEVPRTHATSSASPWRGTTVGTDLRRDLDQNRSLTYLQYHNHDAGGDGLSANLSWHQQDEDQYRTRSNNATETSGFRVGTLGAFAQLTQQTSFGRLVFGADYYRDYVDSYIVRSTPQAGDEIQGPLGDNATYDLFGIYLQDEIDLGDQWSVTLGGRFTYAAVDADQVRDPATSTQIAIEDDWTQVTGNFRLAYEIDPDRWMVYGGVSQGFRAPTLHDLTSFELARTGEIELPTTDLDPEHYLQYELGTKARLDDVGAEVAWFYTDIEDQITRYPTGNVNGQGQNEIVKANAGDGYVQGVEFAANWWFAQETSLFGSATWQYGQVSNYNAGGTVLADEFVSRLMPLTLRVGVLWEQDLGPWWAETDVVHADMQDKLSSGDVRDTQRIPPGGTAGYTLWNIRGGYRFSDRASLDIALENITDYDYRVHGSGSNGLGRNLVVGMTVSF